ncbi:MAG: hypothetical protein ACTSSP_04975 [Candidatus Asgardarchaeia archaeon]
MVFPVVYNKKIDKENFTIYVTALFLENGISFLATDKTFRLGNLAIAIPSFKALPSSTSVPLSIFGGQEDIIAKIITEKISSLSGKAVVSFISLSSYENEKVIACIEAFKQILKEINKQ